MGEALGEGLGEVVWAGDATLLALALLVLEIVGVAIAPGATLAK